MNQGSESKSHFQYWQLQVDQQLEHWVCSQVAPRLSEAMRYSVLNGGKRIRPLLVLLTCEALGAEPRQALPAACALEMIHCYSLIHDDLPALDNDDWRRGQPSCHRRFGEAMAILAGDALLTRAFEILTESVGLPPTVQLQLIQEIACAAGPVGMCAGQVLDMFAEIDPARKLEAITQMYQLKTGALIRAAVRCGALAGGASSEQLSALSEYATALGVAFQIQDDILDLTGSLDSLGKTPQKDLQQQKHTWPWAVGLDEAQLRVRSEFQRALAALARAQVSEPRWLEALARYLVERQT